MPLVHAVYERGVFRPTEPVELPDGCFVEFEPRFSATVAVESLPAKCINELKQLSDGWLDGKGLAPLAQSLDWLSDELRTRYHDDLPAPFIYPTPEGGVQLEWTLGDIEASLEIDLVRRTGEWHSLNLTTDAERTQIVDLNTEGGWREVASLVRSVVGGCS